MTLWSGRFAGEPDPRAFDFGTSFRFDRRLFEDDVSGSLAWADALHAAGVLSDTEQRAIQTELTAILERGRESPSSVTGSDEDVHTFVERLLVERLGDTGKRLHTGRSRNEQVSLDLRLYLRRRIPILQSALVELIASLAEQARRADTALMPAYTHFRRAQPVLVAHFFLAHTAPLQRDHRRLGQASAEADALPLGSGAVAGTSYAIDTAALARRLGFSRVVANSIDAASDRDFVASFLHASALTMVHLSRIAEDLIILSGEEFGFFDLSDETSTGSSMMPQKKNPDPLELVRGKAGRAIGHVAGWLTTMKGLPSGYNKDLQEDKEATFDTEDTLAVSLAAVTAVVDGLTLKSESAGRAASGLLLATDVADYLVARGLPFRQAHEVVAGMVRSLMLEGRDFVSLTLEGWRSFSPLFDETVFDTIRPEASVARRRTPQSTQPDAVRRALALVHQWVASERTG